MFDFRLYFISVYFCSILYSSGQVDVQIKAHPRIAPFVEFSRIIGYKIAIDLVFFWCKTFLFLLPRSWIFLVFLPRSPKIFLDFFLWSWKILQNLANLAKNNCQDLGKKCQKSKKFLGKKTKTPSTGLRQLSLHSLNFQSSRLLLTPLKSVRKFPPLLFFESIIEASIFWGILNYFFSEQARWNTISRKILKCLFGIRKK